MAPQIRLIAVDLDGTLLSSHHQMTPRTEAALKTAIAQGVKVVIATGKTRSSAREVIARLRLTTPGVYNQGLAIHDGEGRLLHEMQLDPDLAREMIEQAISDGDSVVIYSGGRIFIYSDHPEYVEYMRRFEPLLEVAHDPITMPDMMPINKLMLVGEADHVARLRTRLTPLLHERATLVQAVPWCVEILPLGASKGGGLRFVLDYLGIVPEEVLAIGDGENDTEMLQLAGIGVAMGNAHPKLIGIADYVTASNDEDGVGQAVERFVLAPEIGRISGG